MRIISLAEVEGFVKHTLQDKLQRDLRNLRILKEGDVECCSYYHLRKILMPEPNWRVFAHKFSQKTGYYTDLVIYHRKRARIAIEIKWGKKNISKKDRKALGSARKNLPVKKTYFYSVMLGATNYRKLRGRRKAEEYRLFERTVDVGYRSKHAMEGFRRRRRE